MIEPDEIRSSELQVIDNYCGCYETCKLNEDGLLEFVKHFCDEHYKKYIKEYEAKYGCQYRYQDFINSNIKINIDRW